MGSIDKTAIAARMKAQEHTTRAYLPPRSYTLMRIDGRAFHTYCKSLLRPHDTGLTRAMQETMKALCEEASGCVMGYCQSDEISLLLTDFGKDNTQGWFGGNIQKLTSITASVATAAFNAAAVEHLGDRKPARPALFDSRAWSVADPLDVAAYMRWRQADAERNSVSMLAQAHFSHRDLHGKGRRDMIQMLEDKGVMWDREPVSFRRGSVCVRRSHIAPVEYTDKRTGEKHISEPVERKRWEIEDSPIFHRDPFLTEIIPQRPVLDLGGIQHISR